MINRVRNSAQGAGAIWINLTTDQVKQFMVLIPPYELQMLYRTRLNCIGRAIHSQRQALGLTNNLFASLQHRAFNGELTSKDVERELVMAG